MNVNFNPDRGIAGQVANQLYANQFRNRYPVRTIPESRGDQIVQLRRELEDRGARIAKLERLISEQQRQIDMLIRIAESKQESDNGQQSVCNELTTKVLGPVSMFFSAPSAPKQDSDVKAGEQNKTLSR